MSKTVSLVLLAIALVLAVALNPSAERHREGIRKAIAERSELQRVFGVGELKAFFSLYRSLGVASYTTLNDRVVSVGAFGLVIVLD